TNLAGASLKESDLSRGVFSEDVWGQFSLQGANLCHAELDGLDPRKVDTSGIKIAAWQQELILEALGIVGNLHHEDLRHQSGSLRYHPVQ
ncbi:hypothetical protein ACUOA8_29780, partial [Escherichia sp. SS-MK2]